MGKTVPEPPILHACLLSLLAGLCTGLGAFIVLFRRPGKRFLGGTMGFASGVMLVVAFLNLTQESIEMPGGGYFVASIGFLIGAIFILMIDRALPHIFPFREKGVFAPRLYRVGMLVAIGIAVHNIPEGLAVGAGYAHLPALGTLVAIAIAFHNVPEGIMVGTPLYAAGLGKGKAFMISCLSGLVTPVGALAGSLLSAFSSLIPLTMALAGGAMVYLTVDELIPASHHYGHEHSIAFGLILGFSFAMLLSTVLGG